MKAKAFIFLLFFTFAISFFCSADAQTQKNQNAEIKLPLDSYFVKAPDGDRLDNYLLKTKDKVTRITVRPGTTTPYVVRVHRHNPYESNFASIKVWAIAESGNRSNHSEWLIGGGTFRKTDEYIETPIGSAIAIVPSNVADGATGYYYVNLSITNCTNGIIRIEVEKF